MPPPPVRTVPDGQCAAWFTSAASTTPVLPVVRANDVEFRPSSLSASVAFPVLRRNDPDDSPSSRSALRLVTVRLLLTFRGAWPLPALSASGVPLLLLSEVVVVALLLRPSSTDLAVAATALPGVRTTATRAPAASAAGVEMRLFIAGCSFGTGAAAGGGGPGRPPHLPQGHQRAERPGRRFAADPPDESRFRTLRHEASRPVAATVVSAAAR